MYDHHLVLEYPSLERFLTSSDAGALDEVRAAAAASSALLVSIRTRSPSTDSPWIREPSAGSPNGGGASSSSSSSSAPTLGGASASSSPPPLGPRSLWIPLELACARVYSAATVEFLRRDDPLATIDVVVEPMRVVALCTPTGARAVRWTCPNSPANARRLPTPDIRVQEDEDYEVVALGGTFDHLHAGHKILLTMACSLATRKLIVGVSGDELLGKKQYREFLEPLDVRIRNVERFIQLVRPTITPQVVPLHDVYGPTATDPDIQALVVSDETRAGGEAINKLRGERSLSTLATHVINLVADDGSSASTTTIGSPSQLSNLALPDTSLGAEEAPMSRTSSTTQAVKVAVETKMGSTGIREWLARRATSTVDGSSATTGVVRLDDKGKGVV